MKYTKRNGKYIIEKDGAFFAMTPEQCEEMQALLSEIDRIENPVFECLVDGDHILTCVWDEGNINDCSIACSGVKKESCDYWRSI